jgi:hypothetical protein
VPFESNPREPSVVIVFPGAPERQTLVATMAPIDEPWMFDVTRELLAKNSPVRVGSMRPKGTALIVALDVPPGTGAAA